MEKIGLRYEGMGPYSGISVYPDESLSFALEKCGIHGPIDMEQPEAEEFCSMLGEWFYSGSWREVRDECENEW